MRGYKDTLILVSADCPVEHGVVPTAGKAGKPAHVIQYELLSKPHPCLRASMLPKKFGWGVHYDSEGRIALYGKESPEYRTWASTADPEGPKLISAMRNKRE
jgi:hypothetical protein